MGGIPWICAGFCEKGVQLRKQCWCCQWDNGERLLRQGLEGTLEKCWVGRETLGPEAGGDSCPLPHPQFCREKPLTEAVQSPVCECLAGVFPSSGSRTSFNMRQHYRS